MRQRKITMRHPKVEGLITVQESAVGSRVASGWVPTETPKPAPKPSYVELDVEDEPDKPAARRGRRTTTDTEEF